MQFFHPQMESKGDEASHQPSERIKPTSHSQYLSTSMQDSSRLAIPTLLPELITEILLRLPVKSLLQFQCVSKSWLALISGQEFIKTHLSLSAKNEDYNHHKLMWRSCYNFKVCSIRSLLCGSVVEASDWEFPCKSFNIVGSVNGLMCLTDGAKELILWNPTISKYKKLSASKFTILKKKRNCLLLDLGLRIPTFFSNMVLDMMSAVMIIRLQVYFVGIKIGFWMTPRSKYIV